MIRQLMINVVLDKAKAADDDSDDRWSLTKRTEGYTKLKINKSILLILAFARTAFAWNEVQKKQNLKFEEGSTIRAGFGLVGTGTTIVWNLF